MSADENDGRVFITNQKIYDVLMEVKGTVTPLPAQVSDHEVRIRAIEKYLWIWIGAAGVLGAGASQMVSFVLAR